MPATKRNFWARRTYNRAMSHPENMSKGDPWKGLISAVCARAIEDLQQGSDDECLDALFWLASPDASLFLEAVDLPDVDPLTAICNNVI